MDDKSLRVYVKSQGQKYHKYLAGDNDMEGPVALAELRTLHPEYTEAGLEVLSDDCTWECVVKF